jgi:LL-diaminopimelate aminotransferase
MKNTLTANRLTAFPEYIYSKLAKTVAKIELESKRKVLSFGAGTPDVTPSGQCIDKLSELIRADDAHLYPGYGAIPEFSNALIEWYKKRFGVSLSKEEILPLLGAKDGISHLPLALFDEGDEVLVPDPGYPAFTGPALMVGAKPVFYDLTEANNFKISMAELEEKLSDNTKFIWVNFPSNPTGQIITVEELEVLVQFAKSHDLFIIYDNAYSEITFDGFVAPSILQVNGATEVAVEIGSFSKTFSFAGFRMGWIVGNMRVISALAKVKSQMDSGLSLPLQRLGSFALSNFDSEWHSEMIVSYKNRMNIIADHIKSLGLTFSIPKGSLYIWAKIPSVAKSSEEFCMQLLREKQILFTPGVAFGKNGDRYVRVSICVNIDNINKYF